MKATAKFLIGIVGGVLLLAVAGALYLTIALFSSGSALTRLAIIGSAGLLLVIAAMFVERQRAVLIAKAQEWRKALEQWE